MQTSHKRKMKFLSHGGVSLDTSIIKVYMYADVRLEWGYTFKASKYMNGYTFHLKSIIFMTLMGYHFTQKYMNR